jgi:hypothetical protein
MASCTGDVTLDFVAKLGKIRYSVIGRWKVMTVGHWGKTDMKDWNILRELRFNAICLPEIPRALPLVWTRAFVVRYRWLNGWVILWRVWRTGEHLLVAKHAEEPLCTILGCYISWCGMINPLKMKHMFYIRIQCVPRCKHSPLRL